LAADEQRHDHVREHHDVAQRQYRVRARFTGCRQSTRLWRGRHHPDPLFLRRPCDSSGEPPWRRIVVDPGKDAGPRGPHLAAGMPLPGLTRYASDSTTKFVDIRWLRVTSVSSKPEKSSKCTYW